MLENSSNEFTVSILFHINVFLFSFFTRPTIELINNWLGLIYQALNYLPDNKRILFPDHFLDQLIKQSIREI
jgi:hypothetical protein